MSPAPGFPDYGECPAKAKLDDLTRLVEPDILTSQYMDAAAAAKLLATAIETYGGSLEDPVWRESPTLSQVAAPGQRTLITCAALFDLLCNVEYVHGRVTDSRWIYCHREGEGESAGPHAFFSFLKQCPVCCQDRGLEPRLSGAQHKPSSHHIGEITTTAMSLFLSLMGRVSPTPVQVAAVSKQSHDVDAVAWRNGLIVLLEMKASPMVTYPLRARLAHPITEDGDDGPQEVPQHSLVNVQFRQHELELYLANTGVAVPLGRPTDSAWPYPQITAAMSRQETLLKYFEAWVEVYLGYRVPKTHREGRQVIMGYLANGWGDEIDSNKTKPGLGRTDDIKKGTYQLLKYGAYYRAGCPNVPIRGALVANLDPLFMYADYMARLITARWAPSESFRPVSSPPAHLIVPEEDLYFLYDAVLAFNRPILNDPLVADAFGVEHFEERLLSGAANDLLVEWKES